MTPSVLEVAVKRWGLRAVRAALRRYARTPAGPAARGGDAVTILLMHAWGMGGTIRATQGLAAHLAGAGRDVELLSLVRRDDEPFFAFPPGVRVTAVADERPGGVPRLVRPLRRVLMARRSVLAERSDHATEAMSLWSDVLLARALRRRGGIVVASRPALALLALDLSHPGLRIVAQENMNLGRHPAALRRAIRRAYGGLDALVVLTAADAGRYARHLGAISPPIVTIPNAVTPLGGAKADLEAPVLLAAGRLRRQKGFDMLVDAFARVAVDRPEWRLRIAGDGRLHDALERRIRRRGLDGRAELIGAAHDLGAEMARASVFVLSSRFEGLPLVLLEAMGKGMAIIAFACPTGPAEVIDHERDGLLVRAGDARALARALGRVMDDVGLRHELGAQAARTAAAYEMARIGPRWEALLDGLPVRPPAPVRAIRPPRATPGWSGR